MKGLIFLLIITSVTADSLNVCLAKQEQSRFTGIRNHLKQVEQSINNLEAGLRGKKIISNTGCDNGWQRFRDHCYYFNKNKLTWFQAERVCRSKGSFLVSIKDIHESNWVQVKMKGMSKIWIGGNDCDQDHWIWSSDFAPMKYTNWDAREPGNTTRENCAVMYEQHGKWHDYSCNSTFPYICKKHVKDCKKQN